MDFFIVTPSYNQRRFLQQTIDSVLRQQPSGEVVYWVFDGGSTDGTKKLLQKYKEKLGYQSKKDKGQTEAINKGIRELKKWLKQTGKRPDEVIFAYLNSDDYYLRNAFTKVEQAFTQSPRTKWLVSDCLIVDEKGRPIQRAVRWYKQIWRFWLTKSLLGVLNPIPQPGVFIKASEILKIGFFDQSLRYVMDYDYWFKLFAQSSRPQQLFVPLAAFRIHRSSKGGSQYERQFAEQYQVAQRYVKNPVILGLQRWHNALTVMAYRILK